MAKLRKAYILSRIHGTVQIGDTVFQPATGASFKATAKGLSKKKFVMVKSKSMNCAKKALGMKSTC